MNNWCAASLRACVYDDTCGKCMPNCVLMCNYECLVKGCVCFLWAGMDDWTAYIIPHRQGEGLSADSTPPHPLYQKFHACVRAARQRRISISSSKLPSSEQRKRLPRLQIGRLGLSLHSSRTNLCVFSGSLLKTYFFALSLRITSEVLLDAGTFQNCILPFLFTHRLHQWQWIRIPLGCGGGPVFFPTGHLLGTGGWRKGGVAGVVSIEEEG